MRSNDQQSSISVQVLLLIVPVSFLVSLVCGSGLDFCSVNFGKKWLSYGRNRHLAREQRAGCDVGSVYGIPRIIVLPERSTSQREPGEQALGTRIGQDLCLQLPIGAGLGMPSNWTRGRGSIPFNLKIAIEQPLHGFVILKDHDNIDSFHADLQSPASTRNRDERRCTPAIRRAASGYAFATLGSKNKPTLNHVRYNGHALCMLQYFFRDSLVGHPHNFVQHCGSVV